MKRSIAVVATTAAAALAAPAAQAATLAVDPVRPCYRETDTVLLPGSGFTPNARVDFSKNGSILPVDPPILADPAGLVQATLTLPGLLEGQQRLSYMATDSANPANTGEVSLLVTATDIVLSPEHGKPARLLTIRGRGFFGGGKRLWAHIVRTGGSGKARNVKIGKIKGACKKVKARKRIFSGGAAPGVYTVQFDAYRRYKKGRSVKSTYSVTIFRTVRPAASAASGSWRRIG